MNAPYVIPAQDLDKWAELMSRQEKIKFWNKISTKRYLVAKDHIWNISFSLSELIFLKWEHFRAIFGLIGRWQPINGNVGAGVEQAGHTLFPITHTPTPVCTMCGQSKR
jgi:hypothetical protein